MFCAVLGLDAEGGFEDKHRAWQMFACDVLEDIRPCARGVMAPPKVALGEALASLPSEGAARDTRGTTVVIAVNNKPNRNIILLSVGVRGKNWQPCASGYTGQRRKPMIGEESLVKELTS